MGGQPLNSPVVGGALDPTPVTPCTSSCPTVGLTTFSANPSPYGAPITMVSTLTDPSMGHVPTGTLTLIDQTTGVTLCNNSPLVKMGFFTSGVTCTFTPSGTGGVGMKITIRGIYSGDSIFAPNSGSANVVEAGTALTTISVTASPSSISVGSTTTLEATMSGSPAPTGNLTFLSNNSAIAGCGRIVVQSGVAQSKCNYSPANAGSYTITATYGGDVTYAAAGPSAPVTVNVS